MKTRDVRENSRLALRYLLAAAMTFMGVAHFVVPGYFLRIMPDYLPSRLLLVQISGFFEILGGVGLLVPRVRRAAGYGLIALFLAVFPANIYSAVHHIQPLGHGPAWVLWVRLPFQFVLIALAYWVSRDARPSTRLGASDLLRAQNEQITEHAR